MCKDGTNMMLAFVFIWGCQLAIAHIIVIRLSAFSASQISPTSAESKNDGFTWQRILGMQSSSEMSAYYDYCILVCRHWLADDNQADPADFDGLLLGTYSVHDNRGMLGKPSIPQLGRHASNSPLAEYFVHPSSGETLRIGTLANVVLNEFRVTLLSIGLIQKTKIDIQRPYGTFSIRAYIL
ncbi:uncharacterized protein BYT42DRAFT_622042 [Radiomyces spectabilis]|uniref:uncharacterized protein n=1 Tax=Radiomyces spectabilis TaxID=64574 RepID=UPI00221EF37B|nr:uncharacterized protein BYT42DRAFT_622042 [Radiomyces spectabilis]KAI8373214.1 hypothetical protein BYT42DRAFT_622042 [Radiomyces spectabilis]